MKKLRTFPRSFCLCLLDRKAFSLLELVIVMLLLGLSSIIVLPSVDKALKNRDLRDTTLKLAAAARSLRSKAVYENSLERLVVDQRANSYQASSGKTVMLSSAIRFAAIQGGEPLGDGLRQFLFFPNGSLLGGEIGLSNREGASYAIRLDPLLGRVAIIRGDR